MANNSNAAMTFEADIGMSESLTIAESSPPEATNVHHPPPSCRYVTIAFTSKLFSLIFSQEQQAEPHYHFNQACVWRGFNAYTDLLTYWSPKTRVFLESGTNELKFDAKPHIIRGFLPWAYTGGLPRAKADGPDFKAYEAIGDGKAAELRCPDRYYRQQNDAQPLDLYIFTMHFNNRKLRNQALDVIFEFNVGGRCPPSYIIVVTAQLLCKMLPSKLVMSMLLRRVDKASGRKKPLNACGHPEHENYKKTSCPEFFKEEK